MVKTEIRLPAEIHKAVIKLANQNDRSMNSQLIQLIKSSLPSDAFENAQREQEIERSR